MPNQVKYTQKLKDAKVLVVGGTSGIGYCVAEALVENGVHVTVSSSNQSRVEQTISRLQKAYPSAESRVSGHACNLGDEDTLESNIVDLLEKVGKVDHIIYTAGDALASMKLSEVDMTKIKQAGMVRFFSPMLFGKHASKYLTGGPKSSFTITTGAVSEHPIPDWTVVGSYATGLQGMTRQLALDLKPIRVNLVSPGAVDTELWTNTGMSEEQKQSLLEGMKEKLTTGRVPGPENIAEAYLYLLKDENITGSMISTNGGHLIS
ncbi:hypothetical protein LTR37_007330 [Vermiconidia calcicola]|uniref:Uncharacterized protein n=1 Tax=Vermiconidia calcicola TaxID=1690605 RepID=A0ACC3NE18_9PEZI|nr:hypothetical protein LTR37_007330 [Vermiconidia calcicola]